MDLEHPLEAVAFRLYSLPDATAATGAAAWTCLAAVLAAAAAAGLWRLRSSAPAAVTTGATAKPLKLDPAPAEELPTAPPCASERSPEPAAAPSPKERYTAYYRDACRVGCCVEDGGGGDDRREDDAEEHDDESGRGGAYRTPSLATADPFGWAEEVVRSLPLSPTAAEVGLGQYRSPTALGGSVVQLWDQVAGGGLTPTASPRRRGRVVATVPGF